MMNIPYGKQHIEQDDIDAVLEALKSDWLTQGPKINEFEQAVAAYHGCKYAVAFSSGTAALHGAYHVSTRFPFGKQAKTIVDINTFIRNSAINFEEYGELKKQYWELITTPYTFVASANGGQYCGGTVKFVDIDPGTLCIDIEKIENEITDYTRVITPVSYAGYPVDIKAIRDLPKVKENNLCIIHDACHAIGARRNGTGIIEYADMTILSFHPVKHITTGEGGMVLTNNMEYYDQLLLFRSHGITKDLNKFTNQNEGKWYYEMLDLGYNYRITDFQCALGISQMKKLDQYIYKRNQIASIYDQAFQSADWIITPPKFNKSWLYEDAYRNLNKKPDNLHSYHLYPIRLDISINRKNFFDYMRANNIGVQVHYIPVDRQPYYRAFLDKEEKMKNALQIYETEISLPMYYDLSAENQQRVVEIIMNYKA